MLNIQNILILLIILILLNNIKINNSEKFATLADIPTYLKEKKKISIYGDIQYETTNNENDNKKYKYQDLDILKPILKVEKTEFTKVDNEIIYTPPYNNTFIKTNLPSQQEERYNIKFNEPSDKYIYKPVDKTKIVYEERTIQNVYEDIINNVKKNNPVKKLKKNNDNIKKGGFEENTFKNIDWEYEGEDDGISYDPNSSNLLAL